MLTSVPYVAKNGEKSTSNISSSAECEASTKIRDVAEKVIDFRAGILVEIKRAERKTRTEPVHSGKESFRVCSKSHGRLTDSRARGHFGESRIEDA